MTEEELELFDPKADVAHLSATLKYITPGHQRWEPWAPTPGLTPLFPLMPFYAILRDAYWSDWVRDGLATLAEHAHKSAPQSTMELEEDISAWLEAAEMYFGKIAPQLLGTPELVTDIIMKVVADPDFRASLEEEALLKLLKLG